MRKFIGIIIIIIFGYQCAPITTNYSERWVDIDDIFKIEKGMTSKEILNLLGEPSMMEIENDSDTNTLINFVYNYKVKMYKVELDKFGNFFNKPSKYRISGPPWGNNYKIIITFNDEIFTDLKLINFLGSEITNTTLGQKIEEISPEKILSQSMGVIGIGLLYLLLYPMTN